MPITEDILTHQIIGPAYREGWQKGYREGVLTVLRRQLVKRFGPIPAWREERLALCSVSELIELCDHMLDAQTPEDLAKFRVPPARG
jgi:hypothetical protein